MSFGCDVIDFFLRGSLAENLIKTVAQLAGINHGGIMPN